MAAPPIDSCSQFELRAEILNFDFQIFTFDFKTFATEPFWSIHLHPVQLKDGKVSGLLFVIQTFVFFPRQNLTIAIHIQITSLHRERSCATFMSQ